MMRSIKHPRRVLALVLIASALNVFPIALPGGAYFFLGPFVYMPLVLLLPVPWGILAAAIPLAVTIYTLGHPIAFAIGLLEAMWLNFARVRWRRSAILQDAMFWLVAALPTLLWLYQGVAQITVDLLAIAAVKQVVNQLGAVTVAVVVLRQTRLPSWLENRLPVRRRLRDVFFFFAFLLVVAPLMLLVVGGSMLLHSYCEREVRDTLSAATQALSQRVTLYLDMHAAAVTNVANTLSRGGADASILLEEVQRVHPDFVTMIVTDARGQVVHAAPARTLEEAAAVNVSDRNYFRYARDHNAPFISGVFRGRSFGRDVLVALSAPIHDAQGQFAGVVEASLEVNRFAEQIIVGSGANPVAFILADRNGRVIYADSKTGIPALSAVRNYPQGALLASRSNHGIPTGYVTTSQDGWRTSCTALARRTFPHGIVVIAESPLLAVFKRALPAYALFGAIATGTFAMAVWVARRTRMRAAEPLEHFATNAIQQAAVREVAPIKNPSAAAPYEVWIVYRAFNQLAAQVRATHEQLRQTNRELDRRVAERTADADAARRQAEAASQSKTDFLARTGHEIRTPLNAILGHADLLLEGTPDPAARERVLTISKAGRRLLNVLNDLLDLSKIEAGKVELHLEPVDLRALYRELMELLSVQARKAGLRLDLEFPGEQPTWVCCDGPRLQQVLINLAGNALKFTPAGRVCLAVEELAATPTHITFRLAVRDTGPGISAEQQKRLFQPYAQLDPGATSGTGLGLVISRQLVELMGGELRLCSEPGHGTEFFFIVTLPVAATPAPPAELPARGGPAPRVLVADDNLANLEVVRSFLEGRCARLETVETAHAATAAISAGKFDVALVDLEMPDGDGYAVARAARQRTVGSFADSCRLIAFSAHRREDVWRECSAAGFDDFVEKPVARAALLRAVLGAPSLKIAA